MGFGLEQGFTIQGAPSGVILTPAIPGAEPAALIELVGASDVAINNLTLQGGVSALVVEGGSNNFSASNITAAGDTGIAFNITTSSPNGALSRLTADDAGGAALEFAGTIGSIVNFTAIGDQDGIVTSDATTNSIGKILNSTFENNSNYGLELYLAGASVIDGNTIENNAGTGLYLYFYVTGSSVIEGNTIEGNATGAYLDGSGIVFGDANVGDEATSSQAIRSRAWRPLAALRSRATRSATILAMVRLSNSTPAAPLSITWCSATATAPLCTSGAAETSPAIRSTTTATTACPSKEATLLFPEYVDQQLNRRAGVEFERTGRREQHHFYGYLRRRPTREFDRRDDRKQHALRADHLPVANPQDPNYGVGAIVVDANSTGAKLLNNIIAAGAGIAIPVRQHRPIRLRLQL